MTFIHNPSLSKWVTTHTSEKLESLKSGLCKLFWIFCTKFERGNCFFSANFAAEKRIRKLFHLSSVSSNANGSILLHYPGAGLKLHKCSATHSRHWALVERIFTRRTILFHQLFLFSNKYVCGWVVRTKLTMFWQSSHLHYEKRNPLTWPTASGLHFEPPATPVSCFPS